MSMSGLVPPALPDAQTVVNFKVVGAVSVNVKIMHGPVDKLLSRGLGTAPDLWCRWAVTNSGQMLRLLVRVSNAASDAMPTSSFAESPAAGRIGVMSGAVRQELSPAQKSPVWTMFGSMGRAKLDNPGTYVATTPEIESTPKLEPRYGISTRSDSALAARTIPCVRPGKLNCAVAGSNLSSVVACRVRVSPPLGVLLEAAPR